MDNALSLIETKETEATALRGQLSTLTQALYATESAKVAAEESVHNLQERESVASHEHQAVLRAMLNEVTLHAQRVTELEKTAAESRSEYAVKSLEAGALDAERQASELLVADAQRARHEAEQNYASVASELATRSAALERLEDRHRTATKALEDATRNAENERAAQSEATRKELNELVAKLSGSHAAQLEHVESEHEEAIVKCNDKLEATVEAHREEVEALKAKFAEIVEELSRRHDDERARIVNEHVESTAEEAEAQNQQVAAIEAAAAHAEAEVRREHMSTLKAVTAERSEAEQRLAEQRSKAEVLAMKNASMEDMHTSIASELEQERGRAVADMQEELNVKRAMEATLMDLKADLAEKTQAHLNEVALTRELTEARSQLHSDWSSLRVKYEEMQGDHKRELGSASEAHAEKLQSTEAQLHERHRSEMARALQESEEQFQAYEERLISLTAQHNKTTKALAATAEAQAATAKAELTTLKAKVDALEASARTARRDSVDLEEGNKRLEEQVTVWAKEAKELTEEVKRKDEALAVFQAERMEQQRQRSSDLGVYLYSTRTATCALPVQFRVPVYRIGVKTIDSIPFPFLSLPPLPHTPSPRAQTTWWTSWLTK